MTAPIRPPMGRFKSLNENDADFTRRWVFPSDALAQEAIDLFDRIEAMPAETPEQAKLVLKELRKLNRMLKRLGLR